MIVFIYGTLLDPVLRARLIGRDVTGQPATLHGFRVVAQADHPLIPALVPAPDHVTDGLVLTDLTEREVARCDAYELPFDFRPEPVQVMVDGIGTQAQVYLPAPTVAVTQDTWSFPQWDSALGALSREMAIEIGQYDPPLSGDSLRGQWNMIKLRASVRLRARDDDSPSARRYTPKPQDFSFHPTSPLMGDFFKFQQFDVTHRTFQNTMMGPLQREVFVATDAVILLPYDPKTDNVLLVEQIRMGPLIRGVANPWALEPIAGMIDGGETPQESALREAAEEADLHNITLESMFNVFASPGSTTDYFYCFAGICDLPAAKTYTGGLASEAEDLRLHILPFDQAFALIETGEANVAPLVAMLLWLARYRDRLRGAA